MTANATRCLLQELGYSVEWAQNGVDALEALATHDFSAIILDLIMPDMDGFHVIEHLHTEKPALLRKVIVTTGIPEKYARAVDPESVAGIIRKPVDAGTLERLLTACNGF